MCKGEHLPRYYLVAQASRLCLFTFPHCHSEESRFHQDDEESQGGGRKTRFIRRGVFQCSSE